MRYVLLVCDDENVELSQEQVDQRFAEYTAVQ
jgi:hypothetical protein